MKSNYLIIAIVAFVLGFAVSRIMFGGVDFKQDTVSEVGTVVQDLEDDEILDVGDKSAMKGNDAMTIKKGDIDGYSVLVEDQPAGIVVFISSLEIADTSWVAVHEDRNGVPGNILGAQRFYSGDHPEGGRIELERGTQPNGLYYVIIHKDDDTGGFDYNLDIPLVDDSGNMVMGVFTASDFRSSATRVEPNETVTAVAKDGCTITGCGNELCEEGLVSTACAYRSVHACYKDAVCERQVSGQCGWTETDELSQCLGSVN